MAPWIWAPHGEHCTWALILISQMRAFRRAFSMKSTKRTEEEGRRWQPGHILADEASRVHIRNGAFGKTLSVFCAMFLLFLSLLSTLLLLSAQVFGASIAAISAEHFPLRRFLGDRCLCTSHSSRKTNRVDAKREFFKRTRLAMMNTGRSEVSGSGIKCPRRAGPLSVGMVS